MIQSGERWLAKRLLLCNLDKKPFFACCCSNFLANYFGTVMCVFNIRHYCSTKTI